MTFSTTVDDYSIYVSQLKYMLKDLENLFLHADVKPENYEYIVTTARTMEKNIQRLELIAWRKLDEQL